MVGYIKNKTIDKDMLEVTLAPPAECRGSEGFKRLIVWEQNFESYEKNSKINENL